MRGAVSLCVLGAVLAGPPTSAAAMVWEPGVTWPTRYSSDGSAENRAAARHDAPSLLAKIVLPQGATRLSSEPAGDNGYLKPQFLESDMANAAASEWWRVPASPSEAIAFVEVHRPAGAQQSGTSSGGSFITGTTVSGVEFQWPAVPGVLGQRTVSVTATSLRNGSTGVLVQSQSDWVVLRPWSERLPAGVRRIKFSSVVLRGSSPPITLSVTRPSRLRAVLRLVNSFPVAQPTGYMCPAQRDPRLITIDFEDASGASLAVLTYEDFRPWLSPSEACKTIDLKLGGRSQWPLVGGQFLQTLTKLLGRTLV